MVQFGGKALITAPAGVNVDVTPETSGNYSFNVKDDSGQIDGGGQQPRRPDQARQQRHHDTAQSLSVLDQ